MNNPALDIFIGLVFIYLLYSLLASIIQEILARWLGLRARMLQKSLRRMLEDDNRDPNAYWKNTGLFSFFFAIGDSLARYFKPYRIGEDNFLVKFYSHPTIKYLGEGEFNSRPAYLQASTFSETMFHLLRGDYFDGRYDNESQSIQNTLDNNTLSISEETRKHLRSLFADSKGDAVVFKRKLEDWYNEVQDRATGWYKRQNQVFLIGVGFFLAASFNVDTIAISNILIKNKNVRDKLVELAGNRMEAYKPNVETAKVTTTYQSRSTLQISPTDPAGNPTTVEVVKDSVVESGPSDEYLETTKQMLLDDANLVQGILGLNGLNKVVDSSDIMLISGFYDSLIAKTTDDSQKVKYIEQKNEIVTCLREQSTTVMVKQDWKLLGWLITALAISLGAPFWFDLLSKLMQIRGNGAKQAPGPPMGSSTPGSVPAIDQDNNLIRG